MTAILDDLNPETTYFTSDLHIGHANISKYSGRPYPHGPEGVEEMNEDLVTRWNSVVPKNGTVVILGDLCMGRLKDSLALTKLQWQKDDCSRKP